MSAIIRAAHAAALLEATDELLRCVHAVDEGLDVETAIVEMRVAAACVDAHVRALLESVLPSAGEGDAECIACGQRFSSAEGHPTVALGPCCWTKAVR